MSTYDAGPNRKIYSDHSSAALKEQKRRHPHRDREGLTIWIADAHRGDGQRFVVHADEKLTAFLELESAIWVVSAKSAQSAV